MDPWMSLILLRSHDAANAVVVVIIRLLDFRKYINSIYIEFLHRCVPLFTILTEKERKADNGIAVATTKNILSKHLCI